MLMNAAGRDALLWADTMESKVQTPLDPLILNSKDSKEQDRIQSKDMKHRHKTTESSRLERYQRVTTQRIQTADSPTPDHHTIVTSPGEEVR